MIRTKNRLSDKRLSIDSSASGLLITSHLKLLQTRQLNQRPPSIAKLSSPNEIYKLDPHPYCTNHTSKAKMIFSPPSYVKNEKTRQRNLKQKISKTIEPRQENFGESYVFQGSKANFTKKTQNHFNNNLPKSQRQVVIPSVLAETEAKEAYVNKYKHRLHSPSLTQA